MLNCSTSRFNSSMTALRHANLDGVYDTHTNLMFYPKITQPTHAKWEQIPPPSSPSSNMEQKCLTNGLPNGDHLPNGDTYHAADLDQSQPSATFSPVPPVISRNFTVIDTTFSTPPISHPGYPGPDGHVADLASGPNGLSTVPDDPVAELPEECRRAFEEARRAEVKWKKQWGTEKESALRGDLKVGLNGYPV